MVGFEKLSVLSVFSRYNDNCKGHCKEMINKCGVVGKPRQANDECGARSVIELIQWSENGNGIASWLIKQLYKANAESATGGSPVRINATESQFINVSSALAHLERGD